MTKRKKDEPPQRNNPQNQLPSKKNQMTKAVQTATPVDQPTSYNISTTDYNDIYLDVKNPASYSSNVKAFVQQKASISLHKRKIKNFKRRKIIVPGPYHSISCDLVDYSMYSSKNNSYKYILCCIDMFSRYSYAKPLKNKTAQAVANQLDEIIKSMQFVPKFFTSDKGILNYSLYIY